MNDLERERILQLATDIAGDREVAERWLEQPLKAFHGRTPAQLILAGNAGAVCRYLESIESGFVG